MSISDPSYEANYYIKLTEATFRKEYITDVEYKVALALPKGDTYWGKVLVKFGLSKVPATDLFLDFRGVSIANLNINGKEIALSDQFKNHKVFLSQAELKEGGLDANVVHFYFFNKYRKDGQGPHTFDDNQDKTQYIWTQFEADYAHYMFPCFDQPDLKAEWSFAAQHPSDWVVLSNDSLVENPDEDTKKMVTDSVEDARKIFGQEEAKVADSKLSIFNKSPRISTYLYAVAAGPYVFFERNDEGFPPMRIYLRKSLMEGTDPGRSQEMFSVTQAGMKMYKEYFGLAYPFRKYDQIFTPEHNYGAMENVGLVTYNEAYLFRNEVPSLQKRLRFSNTNLHELSHMWFGNTITMKWWNDLWLNESFATFTSYLAQATSPDLEYFHPTVWLTFLTYKFWGISTDQLSTTHSITCEITSTDQAEALFDGISYGKGSSFLKQFHNLIGHEAFVKGLHLYFQRHSWQNTELKDFVGSMKEAFDEVGDKSQLGQNFNLTEWCDQWLTSSGVNILEPVIEYNANGSIKTLQIKQSCDLRGKNILRTHKIDVAVFDQNCQQHVIKNVIVKDELTTVPVNFDFPAAGVFVNVNDFGYCKVRFDQKTLDLLENNLHKIKEPLTRGQFWRNAWMLVMDRKMSSLQFFDFVVKQLPHETIEQIIAVALMNLSGLINYYIPEGQIPEKKQIMLNLLVDLLAREGLENTLKSPIVDNIFGFIVAPDHVQLTLAWLESGKIFKAGAENNVLYEMNKKQQQTLVKVLHRFKEIPLEKKTQLLDKVLQGDNSDLAKNLRLTCESALPSAETKAKIWGILTDLNSTESLYEKSARIQGFYAYNQMDEIRPYFSKFYEFLPSLLSGQQQFKFIESFFFGLLPRVEIRDEDIVTLMTLKLQQSDNNANYVNTLNDGIELLIRSKEVRKFASN